METICPLSRRRCLNLALAIERARARIDRSCEKNSKNSVADHQIYEKLLQMEPRLFISALIFFALSGCEPETAPPRPDLPRSEPVHGTLSPEKNRENAIETRLLQRFEAERTAEEQIIARSQAPQQPGNPENPPSGNAPPDPKEIQPDAGETQLEETQP